MDPAQAHHNKVARPPRCLYFDEKLHCDRKQRRENSILIRNGKWNQEWWWSCIQAASFLPVWFVSVAGHLQLPCFISIFLHLSMSVIVYLHATYHNLESFDCDFTKGFCGIWSTRHDSLSGFRFKELHFWGYYTLIFSFFWTTHFFHVSAFDHSGMVSL